MDYAAFAAALQLLAEERVGRIARQASADEDATFAATRKAAQQRG